MNTNPLNIENDNDFMNENLDYGHMAERWKKKSHEDMRRIFWKTVPLKLKYYVTSGTTGQATQIKPNKNSYIPENPRTPKPLTFSKNRLWGAKNRSNTSPVVKTNFRKNDFFFSKTLHISSYKRYLKGFRNRFFERKNGLGDIGNWGSSRVLGNI
ncbi:hypothetical protein LXL04_021180 [Taraxacum kok-saghyz]